MQGAVSRAARRERLTGLPDTQRLAFTE